MEEVKHPAPVAESAPDADRKESQEAKTPGILDKKEIRIALIALAVLVLLVVAWTYSRPKLVAALVNGETVSRMDVVHELERQGGSDVLEGIITDRLIMQDAASKGVTVSDDEVAAKLADFTAQVQAQGQTLDAYLEAQGLTRDFLDTRFRIQIMLEKALGDEIAVSDEEVDAYIGANSSYFPEGTDTTDPAFRAQIRESLKQQKFDESAGTYVQYLHDAADIQYVHQY